jgi:hypothetical protein
VEEVPPVETKHLKKRDVWKCNIPYKPKCSEMTAEVVKTSVGCMGYHQKKRKKIQCCRVCRQWLLQKARFL